MTKVPFAEWSYDLEDDVPGTVFSAARGLYWYCADYHGGMSSALYSILSRLEYKPGVLEKSPASEALEDPPSSGEPTDSPVYDALVSGELDAEDVFAWIQEQLENGWVK